jgi:hypothetical protein
MNVQKKTLTNTGQRESFWKHGMSSEHSPTEHLSMVSMMSVMELAVEHSQSLIGLGRGVKRHRLLLNKWCYQVKSPQILISHLITFCNSNLRLPLDWPYLILNHSHSFSLRLKAA